jgi:hypothetical protein
MNARETITQTVALNARWTTTRNDEVLVIEQGRETITLAFQGRKGKNLVAVFHGEREITAPTPAGALLWVLAQVA